MPVFESSHRQAVGVLAEIALATAHDAHGRFASGGGGGAGKATKRAGKGLAPTAEHHGGSGGTVGGMLDHQGIAAKHDTAAQAHHVAGLTHQLHGNHTAAAEHFGMRDKHRAVAHFARNGFA